MFPRIAEWLPSLDQGPRGIDDLNFSQYYAELLSNGIIRIHQLVSSSLFPTPQALATTVPTMSIGVAALLLQYAQEDYSAIQYGSKD